MQFTLKLKLIRYAFMLGLGLVVGYIIDSLAKLIEALR
jgi:hypothetical protein